MRKVVLLVWALLGCIRSGQSIAKDGQRQIDAVKDGVRRELRFLLGEWKQDVAVEIRRWKATFVEPVCPQPKPREDRCGLLLEKYRTEAYRKRFESSRCTVLTAPECRAAYRENYFRALEVRYEANPWAFCPGGTCSPLALEKFLLRSHNERVTQELVKALDAIKARRTKEADAIAERGQASVDQVVRATTVPIPGAASDRAALVFWSVGLKRVGEDSSLVYFRPLKRTLPSAV